MFRSLFIVPANGATMGQLPRLVVHDFPAVLPTVCKDQDLERQLGVAVSARHPSASVAPHPLRESLSLD